MKNKAKRDTELILKKAFRFLNKQQFVNLGSSSLSSKPHTSPKLIVLVREKYIYLAEDFLEQTYKNIKENPFVSLSSFNIQSMKGFRLNGRAVVVKRGKEYEYLMQKEEKRQVKMATDRVVEKVQGKSNVKSLTMAFLKPVLFYKFSPKSVEYIDRTKKQIKKEAA
jgi:uncharacterized pyridoxamine 5'-phosphate oxidase family protein